ncbi:histidine kinase dimerization/phosphoacceptor domain-containing protein [Streptomyces somaliensis]|uniref:sensor histidine kinase n=1 Tax=Streptomyces somaliensis TaxID=78355 RepID=UPI0020CDEEEC|nr:histidine kinase [Streptomyces somaliensis]MCP9944613.1 histidine kinase dimerization/phosphoacceptor domain-containing protein [Streptomyces somaliensis]
MRWRRSAVERVLAATAAAELLTVEELFTALPAAVCAAALLSLPLRRHLPLVALCATLPAMLTGNMWLPSMVAMLEVAAGRSRRRTAVACALLFTAAACPWPVWELASMTRQEILTSVEAAALMSTGPTALGLLVATRRELRARLAELTATREREQRLEAERAVVRERARLAREMHDTVAHHVGIIAVQAGALRAAETDAWKRDTAESIRRHGVQALEELRDMVGVLRASDPAAARSARPHRPRRVAGPRRRQPLGGRGRRGRTPGGARPGGGERGVPHRPGVPEQRPQARPGGPGRRPRRPGPGRALADRGGRQLRAARRRAAPGPAPLPGPGRADPGRRGYGRTGAGRSGPGRAGPGSGRRGSARRRVRARRAAGAGRTARRIAVVDAPPGGRFPRTGRPPALNGPPGGGG